MHILEQMFNTDKIQYGALAMKWRNWNHILLLGM